MQHPDEGTIHSWLDGALRADEAARVEAHVKECPPCAAAVGEARGFIAASSRILTALDNAPRGVIPTAAPRKRVDPLVWRVAATVLVVAAGTFVVFRNGGNNTPTYRSIEEPDTAPIARPARPITILGNRNPTIAGGSQASAASSDQRVTKTGVPGTSSTATGQKSPALAAPEVAYSATAGAAGSQANTPVPDSKAGIGQANGAIADKISGASGYAPAAAPTRLLSPSRVVDASALDAASETAPPKVIGTSRQIGTKITSYEVTPGDTVTLTELMSPQLQSVVTTRTSTEPLARQSTEKSAAAAAAAPSPLALPRAPRVEMANGVTTLSWADPITGNVLKLSGRMPEARLEQIRVKIERERAAAAAAASAKKRP
jgi:anti-sigma factor RsiW